MINMVFDDFQVEVVPSYIRSFAKKMLRVVAPTSMKKKKKRADMAAKKKGNAEERFSEICRDIGFEYAQQVAYSDGPLGYILAYKNGVLKSVALLKPKAGRLYIELICSNLKGMGKIMMQRIAILADKYYDKDFVTLSSVPGAQGFYKHLGFVSTAARPDKDEDALIDMAQSNQMSSAQLIFLKKERKARYDKVMVARNLERGRLSKIRTKKRRQMNATVNTKKKKIMALEIQVISIRMMVMKNGNTTSSSGRMAVKQKQIKKLKAN
jgi:hypothetical protein